LPGYLADPPGVTGLHPAHTVHVSAGLIVLIALIVIVAIVLLLAIPVWWGSGFDSFSKGMSKARRPVFMAGFGVLIVGLATGVRIIEIFGGALMAAVVLGVIAQNYLTRARPGVS